MDYFNRQPRIGVISTSSANGVVDCAVYGSPQMLDEKTVQVAFGRGRTIENLRQNPNAVYMIMEPGAGILDWKGLRVYMRMNECFSSGPVLEEYRRRMAEVMGEQAAGMISVVGLFEVTGVRPLMDFGQGWESAV